MISPAEYMGTAKTAMPSPDEYMGITPVVERPPIQRPSDIIKPAIQTAKGMLYGELPEGLGYLQKPAEATVDYLGQFFMTPEEEQAMQAKHPTLMATRFAAASLLLPGISEKFASPTEMAKFVKKSPQEQRVEITGLAATYAAFGAATKGAAALAKKAAERYPWLAEPIGKLLKDSTWYRKATIKQRGLAVQSVDDMLGAGLNEAQVLKSLKKSGNLKDFQKFKTEAIKRRAKPEPTKPIVTPEQYLKTKPIVEKPIAKPLEFMAKEFPPEPKIAKVTAKQVKASHAIAREKGWLSAQGKVKPQYRRLAKAFTGKTSILRMTKVEAGEFISALKKVPLPEFVSGKVKVASIPLSKDITPKDFFKREFKEPSLIKIITPSNRYSYTLGVNDLIEPSIKARTAMLNERKDQFDMLDKTRTLINKVGKTSIIEKRVSRLQNKPTKAEVRLWENLNKYKTAKEAGLKGKEADIFTEMRSLTDVMLKRTNEVRAQANLEPIPNMKAYITHISDVFSKKGLAEKYPFPEEIRYWLDFINPKHIYNPTAFKRMVEARPGLLKDPIKALKAMVSMDLKQIYLEQPNMLFREQMKAFKGIMPASTRQWVQAYMNEVVKGMPTKLDNLTNASLDKLGITKMIDAALKPFGRTLSHNPIKDITGQISRVVHDATIWGKIRLVVRNHTQKFLTLGLYDTKAFAKAMLPASKELKATIKKNEFWKISSQQFMEQLPEGMFGKLEKVGFKPYGHSHISNVTFSMKTAYYASKELVDNPKYKKLGWTEKDVQKEMEFGAMTTQYWYNLMGMPEIYRNGLTRVFAVLQSWWQNYATNYWREMLSRAIYGKTGWGKPIPVKWRLGALRHIITSIAFIEGTRRAFGLDYKRIALLGTLPAYLSPPGQIVLGLYNYISATDERGRKKAINQLKWSWSAFVPGSGAWRDFIKAMRGKMTAKELFFYNEREKKRKRLKGFGKLKGLGGL